jgi:hypothetical protein
MNRKASIVDVAFLIVLAIAFSVFLIITGYIYVTISDEIERSVVGTDPNSLQALSTVQALVYQFDYLFLIIFIGFSLTVFITSYQIDTKPIFIPFYILSLAILVIIAAVGQYIWEQIAAVPEFMAQVAEKTMTSYIMNHLILTSIGVGVLSMILIFAKPRSNPY